MTTTDPNQSSFNKAIMTGLFAGISATISCFIFEIAYRYSTGYNASELINVSSLIFSVNLTLATTGILYFYFRKFFKRGDIYFAGLFILITVFCTWKADTIKRFQDTRLNLEFNHLLSGTVLIIGACAVIIPVLFNNKKFNKFII